MRLAWFRPSAEDAQLAASKPQAEAADDTASLIRALAARHEIAEIDRPRAHDFVWQHARRPFDLCVYELGGTPAHDFVAAYAVHYPGVLLLRGLPRHDRALRASRLVVVPHDPVGQALADDHPGVRVRTLPPGVDPLPANSPDVITALSWPPDGTALTYAIAGFAAGRAVIVFDGPETADWPSLDPQNWEPRHLLARLRRRSDEPEDRPICVSIDPRDQTHSLRLAVRRLDGDQALRARLGAAAQAWWRRHATVNLAAKRFEALLDEARDATNPAGVIPDEGTSLARGILGEFGPGPWADGSGLMR